MEGFGGILDQDWESLGKMFISDQLVLHLNDTSDKLLPNYGEFDVPVGVYDAPIELFDMSLNCTLQDSNNSVESEAAYHADFLNTMADAFVVPTFPDDVMEEILQLKAVPPSSHGEMMHCKRMHGEDKDCLAHRNSVKKARMSGDQSAQRNNEIPMLKWYKKGVHTQSDEEEASTSMEDDSNNNPSESKGSSMHEKGKASRGSATDLQSLYARRRRERINKRLRILQGLVPNGTKVDISTMLEEAVHYVKFLQLQIKLLSSDDLWMYAPIAYNGMDIGMYQKLVPNLS